MNKTSRQEIAKVRGRLLDLARKEQIIKVELTPAQYRENLTYLEVMDSMGVSQILALIEAEFDVEINPEVFVRELNSIDAIAAFIARRRMRAAALPEIYVPGNGGEDGRYENSEWGS